MVDYASEEEQVQAIRDWWKQNGTSVIVGALIGILALAGWRGWTWYRDEQALAASAVYERMIQQIDGGQRDDLVGYASTLREQYPNTAYAPLGALAAARAAVESGDLDGAGMWLQWTMKNADSNNLVALARARLARVEAERGNLEQAMSLLDKGSPPSYGGLYSEIRGDVHMKQGDRTAAVAAYEQALDAEVPPPDPQAVQRKLNQARQLAAGSGDGEQDS